MVQNGRVHVTPAGDDSVGVLAERVAKGEWSVPVRPSDAAVQWPQSPSFFSQHGKTDGVDFMVTGPSGTEIAFAHISVDEPIADAAIVFLAGRKDIWERGLGIDAFASLTNECVNSIGASHVWVQFPESDTKTRRLVERCNFIHEATLHLSGCEAFVTEPALVFGVLSERFRRLGRASGP